MGKNIAIFCDGTWNQLRSEYPTNVVLLAQKVAHQDSQGQHQMVLYLEGVGTGQAVISKADQWFGGAFGVGLMDNVEAAYRYLVLNFEPDDRVFVFGFSRGAYTARSLCGLIRNAGILDREHLMKVPEAVKLYKSRDKADHPDENRARQFRADYSSRVCVNREDQEWRAQNAPDSASAPLVEIAYLGLWDTVGALGVPKHLFFQGVFNKRHRFHDTKLSSMVKAARHAQAIDERRKIFVDTPFDLEKLQSLNGGKASDKSPYRQVWFPGDHGSVGGGGDIRDLSDGALKWVAEGAIKNGLALENGWETSLSPMVEGPLNNSTRKGGFLGRTSKAWRISHHLKTETHDGKPIHNGLENVSRFACLRWHADPATLPEKQVYRPGTLGHVRQELCQRPESECGKDTSAS